MAKKIKYIKFRAFVPFTRYAETLEKYPDQYDLMGTVVVMCCENKLHETFDRFPIANVVDVEPVETDSICIGRYQDGSGSIMEGGYIYNLTAKVIHDKGTQDMISQDGQRYTGETERQMRERVVKEWADYESKQEHPWKHVEVVDDVVTVLTNDECVEAIYRWKGDPIEVDKSEDENVSYTEGNEYVIDAFRLVYSF